MVIAEKKSEHKSTFKLSNIYICWKAGLKLAIKKLRKEQIELSLWHNMTSIELEVLSQPHRNNI